MRLHNTKGLFLSYSIVIDTLSKNSPWERKAWDDKFGTTIITCLHNHPNDLESKEEPKNSDVSIIMISFKNINTIECPS